MRWPWTRVRDAKHAAEKARIEYERALAQRETVESLTQQINSHRAIDVVALIQAVAKGR